MISLTVAEAAAALGVVVQGPGDPDAVVQDVVVDSRAVRPGSLFVALPGEHADGHAFVSAALAAGAVAAVTAQPMDQPSGPLLVVDDPLLALGRLARRAVDVATAGGLQVVALTGSQGKTSTKDLLAQVLEQAGPTVAPYGNLNNEIGVPLTAFRVDSHTRHLVVEMGARGVGHIAYLCDLTPPQVGLVLNVGQAHVGEFGSQQAIARAKGELVEALPADGMAILNADDPLVWAMRSRTAAPVTACSARGEPPSRPAVWATDLTSDELGRCSFLLHADAGRQPHLPAEVRLLVSGRHHVANAVAAAAAAVALGVDLPSTVATLSQARLRSRSRMEMHERPDDVVVIDDAYNANPDSARAAVDTLAEIGRARRAARGHGQTWAVLGTMLELGDTADTEHRALGRYAAARGIDRLVAVGDLGHRLAQGAAAGGMADRTVVVEGKDAVAGAVLAHLGPGDTVLVKASRGLALDTVAQEIYQAPPLPSRRSTPARTGEDPG
ncbi:MAG TPA: UDP-N-acetylmuramoyl-tripeptide--D-alanyl-D-alanine ligase [Propionibacteriaceae bacterium]|nr:UDP-N-acetylmuramoyl-tripeptide--D-alanyl-D-alanine ligase [Propionibacteriaceae bacterium]